MSIVPPQGLILVTGANGYVGSVVVKTFLDHGYKVRGTVRSASKYSWMPAYFGPNFSLVEVPDMSADDAFTEVVKGVDGVAHVAASVELSPDVAIIEQGIKGITNILEASAKESSVKRVVITSSSSACAKQEPGTQYKVNQDTFNLESLETIKAPWDGENPPPPVWGMKVYAASKTASELAAFKWVRENKPKFVFNTVVPNFNMGVVVAPEKLGFGSSVGILASVMRGLPFGPAMIPPEWYVNAEDTALLHLGALVLDGVQGERLFAFADKFTWTGILEILHRRFPERKNILAAAEEAGVDEGQVDNVRSVEVLRKLGRDGFKSLEDSVVQTMEAVIAVEAAPEKAKSRADEYLDNLAQSV